MSRQCWSFLFIFFPLVWYSCYILGLPNIRSISNILCRKTESKEHSKVSNQSYIHMHQVKKGKGGETSMSSCFLGALPIVCIAFMFQVTQHIPFLARSSSPDVSARVSLQFVQFLRQFAQHTSTQTGTAFGNGFIQAAGGKKNKNMPKGRVTSSMHIHAFLPCIKDLLLGNLNIHSK